MSAARYSPSWSSGAFITRDVPVPNVPSLFEQMVAEVGLTHHPELWACDRQLVRFARVHWRTRYIPESFLRELGLGCHDEEVLR